MNDRMPNSTGGGFVVGMNNNDSVQSKKQLSLQRATELKATIAEFLEAKKKIKKLNNIKSL